MLAGFHLVPITMHCLRLLHYISYPIIPPLHNNLHPYSTPYICQSLIEWCAWQACVVILTLGTLIYRLLPLMFHSGVFSHHILPRADKMTNLQSLHTKWVWIPAIHLWCQPWSHIFSHFYTSFHKYSVEIYPLSRSIVACDMSYLLLSIYYF